MEGWRYGAGVDGGLKRLMGDRGRGHEGHGQEQSFPSDKIKYHDNTEVGEVNKVH